LAEALTLASVANPESLEPFVALAGDQTGRRAADR
jgi:hypothetical protein